MVDLLYQLRFCALSMRMLEGGGGLQATLSFSSSKRVCNLIRLSCRASIAVALELAL